MLCENCIVLETERIIKVVRREIHAYKRTCVAYHKSVIFEDLKGERIYGMLFFPPHSAL